jgi:hypothetical protein
VKRLAGFLLIMSMLLPAAFAYDVPTHFDMSQTAVGRSELANVPGLLANLGLTTLDQQFPSTAGEDSAHFTNGCAHSNRLSIIRLIACGAQFEDVPGLRFLSHFYDPIDNAPLSVRIPPIVGPFTIVGTSSPDWALQDSAPQSSQNFSYKDARAHFYQALTAPGLQAIRDAHWGQVFQTPINATDLFLQVVYNGKLGEENDAVAVTTIDGTTNCHPEDTTVDQLARRYPPFLQATPTPMDIDF